MSKLGNIVVGLGLAFVVFMGVGFCVGLSHREQINAPIVSTQKYTGDHGVSYRIITFQTPNDGLGKVTVQCTYYDNATTIPVQNNQLDLYWSDSGAPFWVVNPPQGVLGC